MLRSVQRSFYGEVHPKHHLNLKTSGKLEIWKAYDNSNHLNLKIPEKLEIWKAYDNSNHLNLKTSQEKTWNL